MHTLIAALETLLRKAVDRIAFALSVYRDIWLLPSTPRQAGARA